MTRHSLKGKTIWLIHTEFSSLFPFEDKIKYKVFLWILIKRYFCSDLSVHEWIWGKKPIVIKWRTVTGLDRATMCGRRVQQKVGLSVLPYSLITIIMRPASVIKWSLRRLFWFKWRLFIWVLKGKCYGYFLISWMRKTLVGPWRRS